jgi:hypothetical protein
MRTAGGACACVCVVRATDFGCRVLRVHILRCCGCSSEQRRPTGKRAAKPNGARRTRCQTKRRPAHAGAVPAAGCGHSLTVQSGKRLAVRLRRAGQRLRARVLRAHSPIVKFVHRSQGAENRRSINSGIGSRENFMCFRGRSPGTRQDHTATEHSAGPPGNALPNKTAPRAPFRLRGADRAWQCTVGSAWLAVRLRRAGQRLRAGAACTFLRM